MKRRRMGFPPNTAAKRAVDNAAGVARAIAGCPPADDALADDRPETMASDLVGATKKAPDDD